MTEQEIENRIAELHAQCAAELDMVRRYELRDRIAPLEKQLDAFRLVRARKFLADMDARRAATAATSAAASPAASPAAMPAASVKPAPVTPAPSAAEIAQQRRAATSAFWKKIVGSVNEQRFGRSPDASPDASRGAPLTGSQKPKSNPSAREVWKKAIAAANASLGS